MRGRRRRSIFFHIREWLAENRKLVLALIACLLIIASGLLGFFVLRDNDEVINAITPAEEYVTQKITLSTGDIEVTVVPMQVNERDEINFLMDAYYAALADGDIEAIGSLRPGTLEVENIFFEKRSEYIESYVNRVYYVLPGIEEGDYVLYAYAEAKLQGIETLAPELSSYYIYRGNDEAYLIYESETDANMDYEVFVESMCERNEVIDLFNKVWVTYNEALDADPALNTFLAEFPDAIQEQVGQALALIEYENALANGEIEEPDEDVLEEPEALDITEIVRATTNVNVRSSDSGTADKLGQVQKGDTMTRLVEQPNGWSKVVYEDQEAFIKSEYLESIETISNVEVAGTVTANDVVNIRSDQSTSASKVGVAYIGEVFEYIEFTDSGWCKIIYNDVAAYIKSDFVTKNS